MIDLARNVSREPFFTHLFRGCLLLESLLKASSQPTPAPRRRGWEPTLGDYLHDERFKRRLKLKQKQNVGTGSNDFDALVRSLTDKESLTTAIERTAKARNTLGHNLVWSTQSLDRTSYDLLARDIVAFCLHVIACLYVPRRP
jgi:hypothetical protein